MQKRRLKIQVDESTPMEILNGFLDKKRVTGIKEKTVYHYFWITRLFFREYYKGQLKNSKELDKAVIKFFTGKSNAYFNRSLMCLKQFFDYCVDEGVLTHNPCNPKDFKYRHDPQRVVNHPPEVISKLLSMPDKTSFTGLRDYTLMLLILDCGIRPGEALKLRITDFKTNEIHVRAEIAKTKRERYLPISQATSIAIKKFISVRHPFWDNEKGILFCGFHGKEISSAAFHKSFREYALKIDVDITPYHLRHTFALYFCRNGGGAFELQKMLGHTKLNQTLTYVNLANGDIAKAHEKYSPLGIFLNNGEKRVTKIKFK